MERVEQIDIIIAIQARDDEGVISWWNQCPLLHKAPIITLKTVNQAFWLLAICLQGCQLILSRGFILAHSFLYFLES